MKWLYLSIQNLKIHNKLIVLLLLPIIGVSYLSIYQIYNQFNQFGKMHEIQKFTKFTTIISKSIFELQKERGLGLGLIGSKGKLFFDELLKQRKKTDRALKKFIIENKKLNIIKDYPQITILLARLKDLNTKRNLISSLQLNYQNIYNYYSKIISEFLSLIEMHELTSNYNETSKLNTSYYHFLSLMENIGQERGLITNVLSSKVFKDNQYDTWIALIEKQKWNKHAFLANSNLELITLFHGLKENNTYQKKILEFRRIIKLKKNLSKINEVDWFTFNSKKMGLYSDIKDIIENELIRLSNQLKKQAQYQLIFWSSFSVIGSIFTLLISFIIIKGIITPIKIASDTFFEIGKDNLDFKLNYNYKNEFTSLFIGIEKMVKEIKENREAIIDKERLQTLQATIISLNHEILNPLAILIGRLEAIKRDIPENDKRIISMEKALSRIQTIINKISSVEKITFEKYTENNDMLKLN